jgi:hypothetical protein
MSVKLKKIAREFKQERIEDPYQETLKEIRRKDCSIAPGQSIAVAVGSRGISNLSSVVRGVIEAIKEKGAEPFIVPAMGSHGGATAEGQEEVLAGYGITEKTVGAPVRSCMEVVELPQGSCPSRVYMDRLACGADGTVVVNRIKCHTDYHGSYESGLIKMCVIGLGKHKQALEIHRHGVKGLREFVPECAKQILAHGNIRLGVGIVENAVHQTSLIRAVQPGRFFSEEAELLEIARARMGLLPVRELDVLIIDEFGKDISGTGVDTNVIGRIRIDTEREPDFPRIQWIVLCDLTEKSHGNATGIGLADFITRRVFDRIDLRATTENAVTSTFLERGRIPIVGETPQKCLEYAVRMCRNSDVERLRIMRIKNTLDLAVMYVSEAVWKELKVRPDLIPLKGEFEAPFDKEGELVPF